MPLTKEDKAEIGSAVAESLTPLFTQLNTSLTEFSKQNQQEAGGQQDEGQGIEAQNQALTEQLTQLSEKLDQQGQEFKQLKDKFTELENSPQGETPADDEPSGDEGKYSNLL